MFLGVSDGIGCSAGLAIEESQHQGAVVNHQDVHFLIGTHGESWVDGFNEISFLEDSGISMLPCCAPALLKVRMGQGADQMNIGVSLLFSKDDLSGLNVNPPRHARYECGVAETVGFPDMICQERDSLFFCAVQLFRQMPSEAASMQAFLRFRPISASHG